MQVADLDAAVGRRDAQVAHVPTACPCRRHCEEQRITAARHAGEPGGDGGFIRKRAVGQVSPVGAGAVRGKGGEQRRAVAGGVEGSRRQ